MTTEEIVLVCATDCNFAVGAAVMLFSALVHLRHGTNVRVYIVDDGLDESIRARMTRVLERPGVPITVKWIPAQASADGTRPLGRVPRAPYARLDVGTTLPDGLERAIYLDCDMLVLADLSELYLADMHVSAMLAVQDYNIPNTSVSVPVRSDRGTAAEATASAPYFNSGLLVIDLRRWRDLDLGSKAIERLAGCRRQGALSGTEVDGLSGFSGMPMYGDQDALNAVAVGHWAELDLRWNVSTFALRNPERTCEPVRRRLESSLDTLRREARIVHYCGLKPWNRMVLEPLAWLWWSYCRHSGWFTPSRGIWEQVRWGALTVWRAAGNVAKRSWHRGLNA